MHKIFDSHLDLAWNALAWKRDLRLPLDQLNAAEESLADDQPFWGRATTTLPEMRRGSIAVCLGTMMGRVPYGEESLHGVTLDFPSHHQTFAYAQGQLAYYRALESAGEVCLIRTADELRSHWRQWNGETESSGRIGLIVAMEGADAIVSPSQASDWFDMGLRCASLVHYGNSAYAAGTGSEGSVTPAGKELLSEFERLGIVLDTTHLCDTSFFEATDHFGGSICASHQACRALVPGQRQFSDEQLTMIIKRNGIVGVPCDAWMLHSGWVRGETSRRVLGLDALVHQVDHICQLAGDCKHVSIGSDLDGGFGTEQTPSGLDSIADLQKLPELLDDRGYSDEAIGDVMGENWFRFFADRLP